MKKGSDIKSICLAGVMAAMVFVFTFTFKVPVGSMGYAHLGDAFIIVSVWILGGKRAWIPAALGAGLADLATGYVIWILPTAIVKMLFALTIFLIAEKIFKCKTIGYVLGVIAAAAVHIVGYSLAWYIIGGAAGLTGAIIPLVIQTAIGAALGTIMLIMLNSAGAGKKLKSMVR